ncbi:beta-glucanase (GH16 family) [Paenibacillus shirakamiensis]|uniref:Beta-glucanase (GH16 family) n=1 Tax=Paenibacillus shirakamiensis TaxID=1265935 RepID=A0ABS4JEM4_9BACL|nr:family 16 glycosylhydrolase [Paenibacillus shirakamiensis]MBP2000165.1 beta-glucanase (GH16 family) [Paenibacillus shirakamiensis]
MKKKWLKPLCVTVAVGSSIWLTNMIAPSTVHAADFPANPISKSGWVLTSNDEFNAADLNQQLWFPYYLPHWSTRELTKANYEIQNGNLVLKITPEMKTWDPIKDAGTVISGIQTGEKDWIHRWTNYTAINHHEETVQNLIQKYGYFELRAKVQKGSGIHSAWWMVGFQQDQNASGETKMNAEVDIFETLGNNPTTELINLHPWNDPNITSSGNSASSGADLSQDFHVYGFEWTETNMKFYLDNQLVKTINQSPNYPMMTLLGLYEKRNGGWTGAFDATVPYPKKFEIDYFRAYQKAPDSNSALSVTREGEDAYLYGTTKVTDSAIASGKRVAGYIGSGAANVAEYRDIYATNAGTYPLQINYISGENRNLYVQVNNNSPVLLSNLNSGSWSSKAATNTTVSLNAGLNNIRFFNNDGPAPDIDAITVGTVNKALSASVSAGSQNSAYPIANISDGIVSTTYQSADAPTLPQNITFNWNTPQTLKQISLSSTYGQGQGITNFDIQVSDDGINNWTTIASSGTVSWSSNTATTEKKNFSFSEVSGKKGLRLVVKQANLTWKHFAVNELEIN